MQYQEFYIARWCGKDKHAGDWDGPYDTYEDAEEYMKAECNSRKRAGEAYHMEVVRVGELQMGFMVGCGKR